MGTKRKSILILAFKYNDILYAINTPEFKESGRKILLLLHNKQTKGSSFPMQDLFDDVIDYTSKVTNWGTVQTLFFIYKIRNRINADIITTSNPTNLPIQWVIKISKANTLICLEDGLMNYYPSNQVVRTRSQFLKKIIEIILNIKWNTILTCLNTSTYLLCPELAVNYWGKKRLLKIDSTWIEKYYDIDKWSIVHNKSIFVGTDVYEYGGCTIEEYNNCVNQIIRNYNIDYYLPHRNSSDKERIVAPVLDQNALGVTLEFIACKYSFNIFSVGSTILFSTVLINPNVQSFLVEFSTHGDQILPIFKKTIHDVIKI